MKGKFEEGTYFFDRNRYLFNKDYISTLLKKEKELNELYYTSNQASALLNCDSKNLYHLRSKGVIKDSEFFFLNSKYYYKKEKIDELVEQDNLIREEYILFKEAAEIIGSGEGYFHSLKYGGSLQEPDCLIYKGKNYIKKEFVNNHISKFPKLYEKDQKKAMEEIIKEKYITFREAAKKLGIKSDTFHDLKIQGKLKEPYLIYYKLKYYVKTDYVEKLKEDIQDGCGYELVEGLINKNTTNNSFWIKYYTLREVLNLLELSKPYFNKWRDTGLIDIEKCTKINGVLYFDKEYIDDVADKWKTFLSVHYTHVEVLELFNTTHSTIRNWKKSNKIPDGSYRYFFSTCYYKKSVIDNIVKKVKEIEGTSGSELYEKFGIYQHSLNTWVHTGLIDKEKYIFHNGQYNYESYYIEDFITKYYEITDLTKSISTLEIAKVINYSVDDVNEFVKLNGTEKNNTIHGDIFVSFKDLPKIFENFKVKESSILFDQNNRNFLFYSSSELEYGIVGPAIQLAGKDHFLFVREDFNVPDGYEILTNRTQMEEYSSICFSHLFTNFIKNKLISTIRKWVKIGDKYQRAILYNKKEMDKFILFQQNGISHKEISERLKVGLNAAKKICMEYFEECYEFPEGYIVNRRTYTEFEQRYKMKNIIKFVENFSELSFSEQLIERMNQINVPQHLNKTVEYYRSFASWRFNQIKGSDKNLYSNTLKLSELFYRIINSLSVKNIMDLNDEQLLNFAKNDIFSQVDYLVLVKFSEWLIHNVSCKFNHPLPSIDKEKSREDNKEKYTPEEYMLYFEFLIDIEKHIPMMIKSRNYTSVWIYSAVHLNCAYRGIDIMKLPSMNIDPINIGEPDFYQENRLNQAQISKIINQITTMINSVNYFEEAKKNNSTYVFTVHPLFYESFATALVIANLHRKKVIDKNGNKEEPLLRYGDKLYDEIRNEEVDREFYRTYKKVLEIDPESLPNFSTRKMNSSFLTYMHHSLIETSGIHPALATAYLSRWRGHKDKNSIIHYILMNDFDGTFEDACIRLFSRGQFGWVYDSLVKSLKINENIDHKEKTLLIRNLKNKYKLIEIEEVGLSIVVSVKQKENVMNFMLSKSKKELLELSLKIFSGDLPARVEAGSCLVGRENCPTPHLDCLHGGCEYYIPNIRILKYIEKEFNATVKEYLNAKYEAKKIKHAQWLKKIMIIVLEAINGLGINFVESHIDSQKMIEVCKKIGLNKWDNVIRKLEKDSFKLIGL